MVHAAFVRSPHAHARIRSMDKTAALAVPGALAASPAPTTLPTGSSPFRTMRASWSRPIWLCAFAARIRSRFVGEGVAMVVAESIAAAKDMAERAHIDYEPLPAVSRAVEAIKPGAPVLWDEAPDNLCVDIEAAETDAPVRSLTRSSRGDAPNASL